MLGLGVFLFTFENSASIATEISSRNSLRYLHCEPDSFAYPDFPPAPNRDYPDLDYL